MAANIGDIKFVKTSQYMMGILAPGSDRNSYTPQFQKQPAPISLSGKTLIEDYKVKTFHEFLGSQACQYPVNKIVGIFAADSRISLRPHSR